jgi:23S rRNA maturation-related 3'-5' exoribonuclease YhaM
MENKGPFINELPQSGEVTLLAVVLEKELRPKRNGGFFLALRFADCSGEIDRKVWENPDSVSRSLERDDVVKVRATSRSL